MKIEDTWKDVSIDRPMEEDQLNSTRSEDQINSNWSMPMNISQFQLSESDDSPAASRYANMVAAVSDKESHIMWISWFVISISVAIFVLIVFISVLVNRKVRKSSFNQYLLFLMLPDIFYSASCGITCALNAAAGHVRSEAMCSFQSFYIIFGISKSVVRICVYVSTGIACVISSLLFSSI
jgi:hypothetical protein